MERVLYFAYGSNMEPHTLGVRRGIAWTRAAAASLDGWRLVLDKPSLLGTGEGMASLVADEGARTWGVLYDIGAADFDHLELTEGVRIGHYERAAVVVTTAEAWPGFRAETAFTLVSDRRDPAARPTVRYRDILVRGAEAHGLPDPWIARLRSMEAVAETAESAALRPILDRALLDRATAERVATERLVPGGAGSERPVPGQATALPHGGRDRTRG